MKTNRLFRSATCAILAFVSPLALAGTATFDDAAGILAGAGQSRVQDAASRAPFNVRILTRNNLPDNAAVDQLADQTARSAGDNTVAIAVDTKLRHLHTGAQNAYLTIGEIDDAQRVAGAKFKAGDWPGGMVAAIDSLAQASSSKRGAGAATASSQNRAPARSGATYPTATRTPTQESKGGLPWGWIILGVIGFFILRRIMSRRLTRPTGYPGSYNNAPPPPPGAPGYGAPGYGQPGYGGGGAMRGGLLGSVLGGVLGYGLGRASAGQSPYGHGHSGTDPNAGNWGGSSSPNDGGGFVEGHSSSGDFGGSSGGADFSGFDSGSSGGADFGGGGGGDFGGGGGSGDF